jgi:HPt (histidine-containing phosphotransfer) domain-containing protein
VLTLDSTQVLDLHQLREMTCDDAELMREILAALIEDTSNQLGRIDAAIRDHDAEACKRLAHYCKGACANAGANAAAEVLRRMERNAADAAFDDCSRSLAALGNELDRLRVEAETLQ